VNRELSIRYNQLLNMCDQFPPGSAICYTEGFRVRVVNPAFGEAVGVAREQLRDRSLLDVFTAVDSEAVEQLTDALLHRRHGRFPLDVRWTARGHAQSGHLTVELVDEALLGELPLLVFLHVNSSEPRREPPMTLDPVAAPILELVASGVTTSVVARQVGLTVDGGQLSPGPALPPARHIESCCAGCPRLRAWTTRPESLATHTAADKR